MAAAHVAAKAAELTKEDVGCSRVRATRFFWKMEIVCEITRDHHAPFYAFVAFSLADTEDTKKYGADISVSLYYEPTNWNLLVFLTREGETLRVSDVFAACCKCTYTPATGQFELQFDGTAMTATTRLYKETRRFLLGRVAAEEEKVIQFY